MGEGNGTFLVECRRKLAQASVTCVDASSRMLALARDRLQTAGLNAHEVEFIRADALTWNPPKGRFDLLVTHFFLDCFRPEQLRHLIQSLADAGSSDASWLLADFQVPPAGFQRYRALLIHVLMYWFFRVTTRLPAKKLSVPDALLKECGFNLQSRMLSDWDLLRSDRWERAEPSTG